MTFREECIQGVMAALNAVPDFPAQVERSIAIAFNREESPVLVVHRGAEELKPYTGTTVYRTCDILVSVISRSDVPDQIADVVMEAAQPVIMAYHADGMVQISESGTTAPVFANADGQACMITTRYRISYCTTRTSLRV